MLIYGHRFFEVRQLFSAISILDTKTINQPNRFLGFGQHFELRYLMSTLFVHLIYVVFYFKCCHNSIVVLLFGNTLKFGQFM